jgi:GH15 family glucan-1,4-alpha-glucosidase
MGNAASEQMQLDVYGEVADAIVSMKRAGLHLDRRLFRLQSELTACVASFCHLPASGLWEQRDQKKHYTYSKAMAWLALHHGIESTRGKKALEWKTIRDRLHRQICRRGFNRELGSFVQSFDSDVLDASALLLPIFGFLPFNDDRVRSTMNVIQRKLGKDGFIYRLSPKSRKNRESAFIACSFWMVQNLAGVGRGNDAQRLFENLLSKRNDIGLLSEEFNPDTGRFMGNFPQALSHIALINAARTLASS